MREGEVGLMSRPPLGGDGCSHFLGDHHHPRTSWGGFADFGDQPCLLHSVELSSDSRAEW